MPVKTSRTTLVGASSLALLLTLAACSASASAPAQSIHVTGDVLINEEYGVNVDGECSGFHENEDLEKGTKVTIKNNTGDILTTTRLEAGQRVNPNQECQLNFAADITGDNSDYQIVIGQHEPRQFSKQEMISGPELVFSK